MTRDFSPAYKRYAVAMMAAVYMLNLVDRSLMVLLLQPIKEDLQLSDTQLGFLTGIAFALFYAVLGVPIARWADRGNRVTIASAAIGLWGLTVMACLFVTSYVQLVCARIAAAVGESGCKPPTYSLVGDYAPGPAERTRAMSIYWLGSPAAALVSFMAGGVLNDLYGWRMTFFLMGIPGLLLAALVRLTIVEPRERRGSRGRAKEPLPSMRAVLAGLWRQPTSRNLILALILLYALGFGLSPWYAAFMMRSHGMGTAELGFWLGLIFGLGGIAGILIGGYVSSRWFVDNERGQLRTSAITVGALVPCFAAFLTLPNRYATLCALIPLMLALNFFLAPTYAIMQRLVPEQIRATTLAVVMLLANLTGMGLGPQIVGVLSDAFTPMFGRDALRYAMLVTALIAAWAAWHFWVAARSVGEDLSSMAHAAHVER